MGQMVVTYAVRQGITLQGFSPETAAFIARTSGLSSKYQLAYSALIDGLVADGVWTKLDALYCLNSQDATNTLLNLVSSSYNLTQVSTPLDFIDAQGILTYTNTAYLDTGFNPTTAGSPKYTQNSAHIGVWAMTNAQMGQASIGSSGASSNSQTAIYPQYTDGNAYFRVNEGNNSGTSNSANSFGHYVANRTASGATQGYKNGSSFATGTGTSQSPFNGNFFLLGLNNNGSYVQSNIEVSFAHFGSSLSSTDVANLYARLNTFRGSVATDTLTIDGNASNIFTATNTGTVTLSTTRSNEIIIVEIYTHGSAGLPTVSSVASSNLTFARRRQYSNSPDNLEIWWALATSPLSSEVITVTMSGGGNVVDGGAIYAFGIVGSPNTAAPWDTNASLAASQAFASGVGPTATTPATSTDNNHTMTLGFTITSDNSTPATPSGCNRMRLQINNGSGSRWAKIDPFLKRNSAPLSGVTFSSNNQVIGGVGIIVDALVAP